MVERKKVLIMEDEMPLALALRNALREEYDVYIAEDGIVGLELAEKIKPDIVLLDVYMPRMGGDEVLQEIRKRELAVPVIVVTNNEQYVPKTVDQPEERLLKSDVSIFDLKNIIKKVIKHKPVHV